MSPKELEAYWLRQENVEIIREAIGILDNFTKDLNMKKLKCTLTKSVLDNHVSNPPEEKWAIMGIIGSDNEVSSQGGRILLTGLMAMRAEMTTIASELIVKNQESITRK